MSKSVNKSHTRLSIWLRQGGQSFYAPLPTPDGSGNALVVVEGIDTIPYPKALAESLDFSAMLTAQGVVVGSEEQLLTVEDDSPVGYLMTIAKSDAAQLAEWSEQNNTHITYTTPLAASVHRAVVGGRHHKAVAVQFGREEVYVALSVDKRLVYAECVACGNNDELLQLMALLNNDFDLRKADFFVTGVDAKGKTKLLGKYFRRCKCEAEWAIIYK